MPAKPRPICVTTEPVRLHAKNLFRKLRVSSHHAAVDALWRRGVMEILDQPKMLPAGGMARHKRIGVI